MEFTLYRILGNDLPFRHGQNQTDNNLAFTLAHEPEFPNVQKRFLLNRIVSRHKEEELANLLENAGMPYDIIPFKEEEYCQLKTPEQRAHYVTNVNPARNHCIKEGLTLSDVVMPFDGASFFRQDGWDAFNVQVTMNPNTGYFALGQWRPAVYEQVLERSCEPILKEEYLLGRTRVLSPREYTLAFTKKADYYFDEDLHYGDGDKVDLFFRLGLAGIWDKWYPNRRSKRKSVHYGKVFVAGWVARLPSGNVEADNNNQVRGAQRSRGLAYLIHLLDERYALSGG